MVKDVTDLLAEGIEATQSRDHQRALELFRQARTIDLANIDALIGIAQAASRLGLDHDATAAYLELAELCIRAGKMSLAAKATERILARDPDHPIALRFAEFVRVRRHPEQDADQLKLGRGTGDDWGSQIDESFFDDEEPTNVKGSRPSEEPAMFSDVITKPAADSVLAALRRQSRGDVFAHNPTARVSSAILEGLIERCAQDPHNPEDPSDIVAGIEKLAGTSLESMSDWDAAATVAIASAHLKPISSSSPSLDDELYPPFDAPKTIQIGGSGVVLAFAAIAQASPFLSLLGPGRCQQLLAQSDVVQCFAGQVLVSEGEPLEGLHLIVSGKANMERQRLGRPERVATLEPGDLFGECALLGGGVQTATVHALADTLMIEISDRIVRELISDQPSLLTEITRVLRARFVASLFTHYRGFGALSESARRNLETALELHKASPGGVIISRGTANGLWFLMAGEAERWKVNHSIRISPTSAFGASQIDGEIVATKPTWLLRLSPGDAAQLFRYHPELVDIFS